jgi:hypothetical protein
MLDMMRISLLIMMEADLVMLTMERRLQTQEKHSLQEQ